MCECVCAHARSRVGMGVCMCVRVRHHHSPQLRKIKGKHGCVCTASSLYSRQLLVCVCMCMYANIAECLQLHKAVIFLLIMKYFVLKIVSHSHTTTPCLPLILRALKHTHTSRGTSFIRLPGALDDTHK